MNELVIPQVARKNKTQVKIEEICVLKEQKDKLSLMIQGKPHKGSETWADSKRMQVLWKIEKGVFWKESSGYKSI